MQADSRSAFAPALDAAVPPPLQPGERLPFWYGMAGAGGFFSLESLAGAPAIIVLAHAVPRDALGGLVAPLAIAARRAAVVILGSDDTVMTLRGDPAAHGMHLVDCNPAQLGAAGPDQDPARVLVIDRNQRIALHLAAAPGTDLAAACLRALDALPQEPAREVLMPAPALLLPNLLSAAQCRHLIARFESGATIDSGMATIDEHGAPRTRLDHAKKRRRDLLIAPDDPDHDALQSLLLRRCAPEIGRAFQASIAHTDRILVACYDDTGGYFRRHRDNAGEHVAFREFAISVNLNTEEYEGGGLLFPECNDHLYRPPTGAGFIFSTSLLHEATPVTRGRRYVLLTFFHSDAAERRRRAST